MLSFAAALWLLHSVVPHVHDSNEVGIVSEWDTHTSNFLQSLFGVDLGDDHLEEFSFVDGDRMPDVICNEVAADILRLYSISSNTHS